MRLATLFLGVFAAAGAVLPAAARADTVVLKDGRTLHGEVVAEDDSFVSIRSEGVLRAHPKENVQSITRDAPEAGTADEGTETETADVPAAEDPATADAAGKGAKGKRPKGKKRRADVGAQAAPLGDQARAWLTELLNRMRSPAADDPDVRRSLAHALRALGPSALPPIRAAADAAEGDVAETLRRVAAAIETEARPGGGTTGDGGDRPTSDAPRDRRRKAADVFAALELRPDQADAVRDVVRMHLRGRRDIARSARADGATRDEIMTRVEELRTQTLATLRDALDPDQAQRLDAMADDLFGALEKRPDREKGPGKKKRGDAPAE